MMRVSLLAAVDWTLTFLCLSCVCRVLFEGKNDPVLSVALRIETFNIPVGSQKKKTRKGRRTNFDQLVPQVAGRLAGASFARKNGRGSSHGSVQWGLGHRDRPCTAATASTRAPALAPFSTGARID